MLASYCTGGVVLLGHLIEISTGMALDDYADIHLFGPLAISEVDWRRSPDGKATGGGGMRLRPRDAEKFGQLYLNGGTWEGQRILAEHWVEESKRNVTTLGPDGYGLLWWKREFIINGISEESFFTSGNGGNYIFVFPSHELVVVFTGSNYNSSLDRQPFDILSQYILKAI